jgi:predicted kinase
MKNTCYILRGLPGTGKSRLATLISAANDPQFCFDSFHVETFSTDDLFINDEGVYKFDADLLKWHHQENLRRATEFFKCEGIRKYYVDPRYGGVEGQEGEERWEDFLKDQRKNPTMTRVAVIDNTNTQHWEYEPYVKAAKEAGWDVQIITLDWNAHDIPLYAKRTKHGVPEEAIQRMADRWEYPAGLMRFGSDEWRDTFA